ncbi:MULTISPECIES: FmdE family protein [Methanobacterium]|uniref:FmdE family protein n=1 Tax=Methanobacterium TaxID=2160 RepID=UPI000ABEA0F4|nr:MULTISPECIES: FmdE family protein [Methanobacterium]
MKNRTIKRNMVLLVLTVLFTLFICGAASAADSSTIGGNGTSSDLNLSVQNSTDSVSQLSSQNNSPVVDPIIGVKVGYEYSSDSINPEITVKDSKGTKINVTKTYDMAFEGYRLSFDYAGAVNGTKFNVSVSAPGYTTQSQMIGVFLNSANATDTNLYGSATFNMKATAAYKLGREVTKKADQLLNFSKADKVLVITTAGLAYLNGTTTEDCLEGILNGSGGKISYGQGNLLTFQSTRTDPLDFCFVVMNGNSLTAAFFKNGSLKPAYKGTFSAINQTLWEKTIVPTFGDDAFGYVSLANAWKEGLSTDILRQAAYHGHVCLGTISGQAMISLLLKYYPPGVYGDDGELEATSYRAVSVPGNSDDDAFIYSLDLTSGKRSWVGYETSNTGAADNMVGFIRWCASTNTGTLIIMAFDEDKVVQAYKNETGLTAYSGIASELKFNAWLINKLENDPDSLVDILYVFNITAEVHNNLTGGVDSKNVVCDALGLDMDYILGLGLTNLVEQKNATNYTTGNLTEDQIKQIGIDAANKAIALFAADGITLEKDDPNLTVFTSAGYVRVNEQVMDMVFDGIYDVLGSRLSRATLLSQHNARFNPLFFQFTLVQNGTYISKTLTYDPETGNFTVKNGSSCIIDQVLPYDPPYDVLMAWLWHNHVCGGSSTGYLITDYVYDNFPIGEDEQYSYVSTNDICRDDILSYLLGVSAGSGTYYNQRMESAGSEVGIISIYDSKTKTRRVAILNLTSPKFSGGNSYENYINLYKVLQKYDDWNSPECLAELATIPNLISGPSITRTVDTWVTEEEWQAIISGGNGSLNALEYIKSLPVRTQADLISLLNQNQNGTHNQNGTQNNNGTAVVEAPDGVQGNSQGTSSSGTGSATGSVGDSGPTVSAATQTEVTTDEGTPSDGSNAYEVSKASPNSEESDLNYALIALGAVLCGGLLVVGFFKGSILGFLRK